MKKTVSLILCALLALSLFSCGATSNVTVAEVKEAICDENWTTTKTSSGLTASVDGYTTKARMEVTADSSEKVSKIVLTATDLEKADALRTTELARIIGKVSDNSVTMLELAVGYCVVYAANIYDACMDEGGTLPATSTFVDFFVNGTTLTVDGWTITNSVDTAAKTCTITAVFNGN